MLTEQPLIALGRDPRFIKQRRAANSRRAPNCLDLRVIGLISAKKQRKSRLRHRVSRARAGSRWLNTVQVLVEISVILGLEQR